MSLLRVFIVRLLRAAAALAGAAVALTGLPAHAADAPAAGCPTAAPPLTSASMDAGMRAATDHGFLWRVTKNGRSSYLYGTIHAGRPDWMFPGPTVMSALRASDSLALELDVLDPDVQRRLNAAITARERSPLPEALTERLAKRVKAECLDPEAFARFVPEFQVASLGVMAARRDGLDPANAIDLVLALVARELGKPISSLETPEMQMTALRMPTAAETVEFVKSGLDDLDSGRARPILNRMAKVWTDGDYAELSRYESWCGCLDSAADRTAMKRLLDDRNPQLASSIDTLHTAGTRVFAAVGSLHMVGPKGLPALFRARGYVVDHGDFTR